MRKNKIKSYLVIPDLHFPYESQPFVSIITKILKEKAGSLHGVIQMGDFCDFPQVSSFDKDPNFLETIIESIYKYRKQMLAWMEYLPVRATWHQLEGNHEDRLRKYVWRNANKIESLVRNVPDILQEPGTSVNFKWHPIEKWNSCQIGDTVFHHGVFYNIHTAGNNLNKYPCKFVQAHTHRLQFSSNGSKWSATVGHGSDVDDTMHRPVPSDWQMAFAIFHSIEGNGTIDLYPIIKNMAIVDGRVFKV